MADVLADHGDGHLARRAEDGGQPVAVVAQIERLGLQAQPAQDLLVEVVLGELDGHFVDGVAHIELLDHALLGDVAEDGQLLEVLGLQAHLGAADQNVGLNADVAQHAHRLLRGLGLELLGGLQVGHVGQVDEERIAGRALQAELARGLQEGQTLDVAGGAANLGDGDVHLRAVQGAHRALNLVGNMRDDLDGAAEVAAGPLTRDDRAVDLAAGVVRGLGAGDPGNALVVTQVEVRLGAIVGDEDLAVLVGAHRAGVDVEVGVELLHGHAVTALTQEEGEGGRGDALAQTADHAAGDEDMLGAHCAFCSIRERKVLNQARVSVGPGAASG